MASGISPSMTGLGSGFLMVTSTVLPISISAITFQTNPLLFLPFNPSQSSEMSLELLNDSFSESGRGTITPTWSRDGLDSGVNGLGMVTPRTDLDSDIDRFLEENNRVFTLDPSALSD